MVRSCSVVKLADGAAALAAAEQRSGPRGHAAALAALAAALPAVPAPALSTPELPEF